MSYLDPQRWGDVDAGGNAVDWSTRGGKLLYPGYEMLRKALVERCDVSSTVIPTVLNTARSAGRIYTGNWFSNFHSTISTLIPKFVNYADNGGSWDDVILANFAPMWTEATILTAIGDASRVAAPDIPFAAWSFQQYKILNKLLWTKDGSPARVDENRKNITNEPFDIDWATTWANLVAHWPGWIVGGGEAMGGGAKTDAISKYAAAGRIRTKHSFTKPTALYSVIVDWYSFMDSFGIGWVFDDHGQGFNEDRWWLWEANDGPLIGAGSVVSDYVGDIAGVPAEPADPPASPPAPASTQGRGWGQTNTTAIAKWDIFGGFKFLDK